MQSKRTKSVTRDVYDDCMNFSWVMGLGYILKCNEIEQIS